MNKKIFHIHKIFYIIWCFIFSTSYTYAAPAKEKWINAPLACLPNRAIKWTIPKEIEPCHCPPQSYCGGIAPKIKPENIKFTVSLGYENKGLANPESYKGIQKNAVVTSFLGTEVPKIKDGTVTIKNILAAKDTQVKEGHNFLRELLNDTIKEKTGVDMAHDWGKNNTGTANTWSVQNFISIELISSDEIKTWLQGLKMPLSLIEQCCDVQICPKGMYPELVYKEIPNDYSPKTFSKTELDKATNDMLNYNNAYNTLDTATSEISAEINSLANNIISSNDLYLSDTGSFTNFDKLEQNYSAYLSYIKNHSIDFSGLETQTSPKQSLQTIQDMSIALTTEAFNRNSPTVNRTSETLSCKYDVLIIREGCIRQGTNITLADSSKEKIENLKIGDSIKTQNGTATITAKSHFTQNIDYMYSINKGRAFFTVEHPILTTEGWKSINPKITSTKITLLNLKGALKVGDTLIREDGKNITITSIDKVELSDIPQAFNLSLSDKSSFYADGYLMKSFGQMQMHY